MEELEERLLALGEHRARTAAERIQADNDEEERPASAAVQAAMGVIGRGGAMPGQCTPRLASRLVLRQACMLLAGSP